MLQHRKISFRLIMFWHLDGHRLIVSLTAAEFLVLSPSTVEHFCDVSVIKFWWFAQSWKREKNQVSLFVVYVMKFFLQHFFRVFYVSGKTQKAFGHEVNCFAKLTTKKERNETLRVRIKNRTKLLAAIEFLLILFFFEFWRHITRFFFCSLG